MRMFYILLPAQINKLIEKGVLLISAVDSIISADIITSSVLSINVHSTFDLVVFLIQGI